VKNTGMEKAGLESTGPNRMGGKCKTGKRRTKFAGVENAGLENAGTSRVWVARRSTMNVVRGCVRVVKWRRRTYVHDTITILWVQLGILCGVMDEDLPRYSNKI